jgi:hypothetical protein
MFGNTLPIWILFFPTVYLVYGWFFCYKTNSSVNFGRKEIEKTTHPVLYSIIYIFWLSVILFVLFIGLDKIIFSIF